MMCMDRKVILITTLILLGILGVFFLYLSEKQVPPSGNLSDEQLLKYAKSPFDKKEMMFKEFILGYHNGTPVVVSFPCSDVCPAYTIRIIAYNVSQSDCESVGGELKSIYVPVAIAVMPKEFCFPKVIVDNGIYEFVEKQ